MTRAKEDLAFYELVLADLRQMPEGATVGDVFTKWGDEGIAERKAFVRRLLAPIHAPTQQEAATK